jgi:hypothetical protein
MADQGYITQAAANKTMAMSLGVKHNRFLHGQARGLRLTTSSST